MMDSKDLEAEIHPLKNEDGKAQENHENCTEKERVCKKPTGFAQLSRWRTAAFFLSLFLCLIVVFAFSFIIPCPVRPLSQKTWHRTYENAVTYSFLAVEDVDKDKVQDIIFAFKSTNGSSSFNRSCLDEGLSTPCAFIVAVSGTDGSTLWERPVTEDVHWMECGIEQLGGAQSPGCLVLGKLESLTAINSQTGEALWRRTNNFGANYTLMTPLLKIPDVDGDSVRDLMIFTTVREEIKTYILSGKNGNQVGFPARLGLGRKAVYLMYATKTGSDYLLFHTVNSLYGYSLKDLYSMATGMEPKLVSLKQDPQWEKKIESSSHHISLLSSGDIRYMVKLPRRSGEDILVVKSDMAELLSGQNLESLWTLNTSRILSKPVLGYYKPDVLDVVLESTVGPNRKKIVIVGSGSGAVQWELELNSRARSPRPATLPTANHRSTFLFWGEYQAEANETQSRVPFQNLYLFHPSYPNALLELANSTEQIVVFDAVLFERSRHACYVLLTGPQSSEEPGLVSVMKRKLKEDITDSKVIWLGQVSGDSEQYIKDRLYRMRFQSQI
ncbi:PREDICTED: protein FAM234A [Crocodylus porosus]|uniref:protein FAM234A n=1 Tax=Crocodylus porosus TaxID=8502 RepID=UPI00093B1301|nr:PREDICTED: protein FAM234A [Crocodylus porosus]XP_019395600.1 PREDICTED: protein FAM234A [Crocodylus porosus]